MEDLEDAILIRQESEAEECTTCPYRGNECRNQCMEIKNVYNSYLIKIYDIEQKGKIWVN